MPVVSMAESANHKGLRRELSRTIGAAIFTKNVKIFSIRNQPASLAIKILIRLPSVATFSLPSRKRGWGCVMALCTHPLSPLFSLLLDKNWLDKTKYLCLSYLS